MISPNFATRNDDAIARVANLTREEFVQQHLRRHTPVVLTSCTSDWPAISNWSLDYLAETHQDHTVQVESYPTNNRTNIYTYVEMTVADYIKAVCGNASNRKSFYLADTELEKSLPHVTEDVAQPALIPNCPSVRTGLFLGHDTFSAAHYHRNRSQALLCQITGEKEVLLYPANDTKKLYPHPWYGLRPNFSRIEMELESRRDSFEAYPRLKHAKEYCVTLKPGECLFIPDHWMHIVTGFDDNVSLTYFWDESLLNCYLPGVIRDYASQLSKSTWLAAGKVGKAIGMHRLMLKVAVMAGVVPSEEQDAVLHHFETFEGRLPGEVKNAPT